MDLTSLFQQLLTPTGFIKISLLIVIFFVVIFTLVLFNQVRVMNHVVSEKHSSSILAAIAVLNIIMAVSLFILALNG